MLVYNKHLFYNNLIIIIPESQQCHSYTFIKTFISDNANTFHNNKACLREAKICSKYAVIFLFVCDLKDIILSSFFPFSVVLF